MSKESLFDLSIKHVSVKQVVRLAYFLENGSRPVKLRLCPAMGNSPLPKEYPSFPRKRESSNDGLKLQCNVRSSE